MILKHLAQSIPEPRSEPRILTSRLYDNLARVAKDNRAIGPLCMRAAAIAEGTGRRLTLVPRSDKPLVQSWLSRGHEARELTESIIESHVTVFAMHNLGFLSLGEVGLSRRLLERALQTTDLETLTSIRSALGGLLSKVQFRDPQFFRAVLESSFQALLEMKSFGALADPRIVTLVMEDILDPVLQAKHAYFLRTFKVFKEVLDEIAQSGPSKELLLRGFGRYFELARTTFFSSEAIDLKKRQHLVEEALYHGEEDTPRVAIWSILNSEGVFLFLSKFSLGGTPILLGDGVGVARRVGVLSSSSELDVEIPLYLMAHGAGIHLLAERLSQLYHPTVAIPDIGNLVHASLRMRSTKNDGNSDALILRYEDDRAGRHHEMVVFDVRAGSIVRRLERV